MKQVTMNKITMYNGNRQPYEQTPPVIRLLAHFNDEAIEHIRENTGLRFEKQPYGHSATPESFGQIGVLFMTYNFKTRYYNNNDFKNTLMLKPDHHVGFDVDSICVNCMRVNHIHVGDMPADGRLAC